MTLMRPGYIYLMHSGKLYKIGASVEPEQRIGALVTGASSWISLVCKIPVRNMRHAERALHSAFASYRVHGEWFALWPEAVSWFRSLTPRDINALVWEQKENCKYHACGKHRHYGLYCSIEHAIADLDSPYLQAVDNYDIADLWGC